VHEVKIVKVNEVFMQVVTEDQGLLREIRERFSYKIENAKYNPLVKAKKWDGIIRLFRMDQTLYVGLLPELIMLLKRNRKTYTLEIDSEKVEIPSEEIDAYINDLSLYGGSSDIKAYDYQITALHTAIRNKRAVMKASTSAGKSLILFLFIRWLLEHEPERQILLVVPNVQLVYQLFKDFQTYATKDPEFDPGEFVQIMHDDSEKVIVKPVVIVNVQAIMKQPKGWFLPFNAVVHDEVHRAKAKTFKDVLESCVNCDRRLGVTGTLDGIELHELTIRGLVGKVYDIVSTREIIDSGRATELLVKMILCKHPKEDIPRLREKDYMQEREFIATSPARREMMYSLIKSLRGNTLVIYDLVEKHLTPMMTEYRKRNPKQNVFVVNGATPIEERERIREILESSDDNVLFCSYGTFSTGVNVKNLKNLVMAMGSKSVVRVKQTLGRMLRTHFSKDVAHVYDIVDDLRAGTKGRPNYAFLHGKKRREYYKEDGYKIIYKEIKF